MKVDIRFPTAGSESFHDAPGGSSRSADRTPSAGHTIVWDAWADELWSWEDHDMGGGPLAERRGDDAFLRADRVEVWHTEDPSWPIDLLSVAGLPPAGAFRVETDSLAADGGLFEASLDPERSWIGRHAARPPEVFDEVPGTLLYP